MKFFASIIIAFACTVGIASAQQAVIGSGAFSASESSQGFTGNSASGAGSIGPGIALSSNVQTMAGTQSSAGFAVGGTGGGTSGAATGTVSNSNIGVGSTSFSASVGQAGGIAFGGNQNQAFSGSAANAFGGFGLSLN